MKSADSKLIGKATLEGRLSLSITDYFLDSALEICHVLYDNKYQIIGRFSSIAT